MSAKIMKNVKLKHLVFYDWFIDPRAGGPTGYLANLRMGLDRTDELDNIDVLIERMPKPSGYSHAAVGSHTIQDLKKLIDYYKNIDAIKLDAVKSKKILSHNAQSIHAHTAVEAVRLINHRKEFGGGPIFFTSHCPESSGKEVADVWRDRGYPSEQTNDLENAARVIEAIAFRYSDVWIFPSKEAMEPYYLTVPQFAEWERDKDVRFIETGAMEIQSSLSREDARNKWDLNGKRVIAFIGRHNEVKGYDLLKSVGLGLLEKHDDLIVLVGGKLDGMPPVKHERWIEIGWYPHPADLLNACDLYVLPNRMTYFDLILLEALSVGAPILASNTGGNKSVYSTTDGAIELFEPNDAAFSNAIEAVLWDDEKLLSMRSRSREAYLQHYTPTQFASNYRQLIKNIYSDHNISSASELNKKNLLQVFR